jgi:hypothetical protein
MRRPMRVEGHARFATAAVTTAVPFTSTKVTRLAGEDYAGDNVARFRRAAEDGNSHVGFRGQIGFNDETVVVIREQRDLRRAVIREAGATIVAAAQSTTSLIPPPGNDKSKVLTLNLRNRMIFALAMRRTRFKPPIFWD